MNIERTIKIDKILKDADQKELSGAEIAALTILGLNPLVFGIPGTANLDLTTILTNYLESNYILSKHEAQAVFAAAAYAATSNIPAFVIVTSGPGVFNAFTGIYDATMEFYPVVVISGNVESNILKNKDYIAFQKSYSVKSANFFAKSSVLVTKAFDIQKSIYDGFLNSCQLPQGASLIDITKDAFQGKAKFNYFAPFLIENNFKEPDVKLLKQFADLLVASERPLVVLGRGAFQARKEVWQFIENFKLPFCYTLKGKGVLPDDHPQNYKYLGMHGFEAANKALYNADLVIIIGASCDDFAFRNAKKFTKGKVVVINPYLKHVLARIKPDLAIESSAQDTIKELFKVLSFFSKKNKKDEDLIVNWHKLLRQYWQSESNKVYNKKGRFISPVDAAKLLNDFYNPDLLVVDVGEHQQHIVRFLDLKALIYKDKNNLFAKTEESFINNFNKRILTSGTAGTMGVSISYAFGASLFSRDKDILTVLGDGTLEMHLSALWFWAYDFKFKYKAVIFNNREYGEIDEPKFFNHKYKSRYLNTTVINNKKIVPEFSALSTLYNIEYYHSNNNKSLLNNLSTVLKSSNTYLFEILVDSLGCYPYIPAGGTILDVINQPPG